MTSEQLDLVVARTGHERFRWLASGDNPDAYQRESYRKLVAKMAVEPPPDLKPFDVEADRPPPVPLAEQPPRLTLAEAAHARKYGFNKCWFSYKESDCGCTGPQCHLLKKTVSLRDCAACLAKR